MFDCDYQSFCCSAERAHVQVRQTGKIGKTLGGKMHPFK